MRYVVIGGGIAGVCCTEELCRLSKSSYRVTLIAAGRVLKVGSGSVMGMNVRIASWPALLDLVLRVQGISNVVRITQNIESFEGKLLSYGRHILNM